MHMGWVAVGCSCPACAVCGCAAGRLTTGGWLPGSLPWLTIAAAVITAACLVDHTYVLGVCMCLSECGRQLCSVYWLSIASDPAHWLAWCLAKWARRTVQEVARTPGDSKGDMLPSHCCQSGFCGAVGGSLLQWTFCCSLVCTDCASCWCRALHTQPLLPEWLLWHGGWQPTAVDLLLQFGVHSPGMWHRCLRTLALATAK
jgi:hypothetical protein